MREPSPIALLLLTACAGISADVPRPAVPADSTEQVVRTAYRGTIDLEAHLARPGDTVPLELGWAQTCEQHTCKVERTTGTGDDASTVTIWSTLEATWVEDAPTRMPEDEAENHRRLLTLFAPEPGRPGAELAFAHPRLGTVTDRAIYADYGPDGVPTAVSVDFHDTDIAWSGTLKLQGVEPGAALDVPTAPPAAEVLAPSMAALGEGLWDVRVPAHDARSLAVEFPSFITVLEAPWSSSVGEQVVDLIAKQLPDKPIRYVLYSHHHPHYTGGLRAFMAAGASVVAPSAHADFVRSIAALDFSLEPDRFAQSGAALELVSYEETFTIVEAEKSLRVIDIGERSNHTAAYNMFWLPDTKTLIQGDIGWFVSLDGQMHVGARSAGLLEAIDAHALSVERLVQTWPVNTQEPTLDMNTFRGAVESAS